MDMIGTFSYYAASKPSLAPPPPQPPVQWVPEAPSLGVMRPVCVKLFTHFHLVLRSEWVELYLQSLNTPSWRCAELRMVLAPNYKVLQLNFKR